MATSLLESSYSSIRRHQQMQEDEESKREDIRTSGCDCDVTVRDAELSEKTSQDGVGLCLQLLLVSSFIGVESIATFSQIYEVLFLQFLDVPSELISLSGVITAATSLILIPFLGWFANTGPNVLKRKVLMTLLILSLMLLSLICLAICGILKIWSLNDILQKLEKSDELSLEALNTTAETTQLHLWNTSILFSNASADSSSETDGFTVVPTLNSRTPQTDSFRVALAIMAFALMDIGFEAGIVLCRSFILECVPPFQHAQTIVIAGIVQSASGGIFALLSTIDITDVLGYLFGVDGTACSVIFFAVFFGIVESLGFGCTIMTSIHLAKRKQKSHAVVDFESNSPLKHIRTSKNDFVDTKRRLKGRKKSRNNSNELRSSSVEADELRRPLLEKHGNENELYSGTSFDGPCLKKPVQDQFVGDEKKDDNACKKWSPKLAITSNRLPHDIHTKNRLGEFDTVTDTANMADANENTHVFDSDQGSLPESRIERKLSTVMDSIRASYSMSLSSRLLPLDNEPCVSSSQRRIADNRICLKARHRHNSSIFSMRFVILLCSAFLANGTMCMISMYSSNALTIGVYHGDPHALPGTEGHKLYNQGLRQAAWGAITMYVVFVLASLCTKKLIGWMGEKIQFTMTHVLTLACTILLLVTKSEEMYFLVMATGGVQRVCVYTLTFTMAAKFMQEQASKEGREVPSKNTAKAIALIGFTLPLHYLIITAIMGPLIAMTGSPWVFSQYVTATASASILIFSLLFILK